MASELKQGKCKKVKYMDPLKLKACRCLFHSRVSALKMHLPVGMIIKYQNGNVLCRCQVDASVRSYAGTDALDSGFPKPLVAADQDSLHLM